MMTMARSTQRVLNLSFLEAQDLSSLKNCQVQQIYLVSMDNPAKQLVPMYWMDSLFIACLNFHLL